MRYLSFFFSLLLLSGLASCKKPAGYGGNARIFGQVQVRNYNATFTILQDVYYAPDKDVFIVAGDDITYFDRIRTNPDGAFEFKFLYPGRYTIYTYSDDSTLTVPGGVVAVDTTIEISGEENLDLGTLITFD